MRRGTDRRADSRDEYTFCLSYASPPPQPFYGPFPGSPGSAGAGRELLDFTQNVLIIVTREIDIYAALTVDIT